MQSNEKKISIVHWIHWISFTNGAYTQLTSMQSNEKKKFPLCIGFIGLALLMGLTLNSLQCNPMKKKISIVHWIHWISFTNGAYTQLTSMQSNEKKISLVHWIHWISFTNGACTQLSSMQF